MAAKDRVVESTLEIVTVATGERRIVQRVLSHFEAPNWTADGSTLVYNGAGRSTDSGDGRNSGAGSDRRCAREQRSWVVAGRADAVISGSVGRGQSQIYLVPMMGGE